jgi:hypothetical protein
MEFLAVAKLVHLVGLIMGLGGAMLADYTTLTRGVIRPVSSFTIHHMHFLSRIVAAGLVLLWISGIAIVWLNTQANPQYVTNQKLWAKVIVVAILTLNGFYIHKTILPSLKKAVGRRLFDEVARRDVAIMTLCGSFSFVSWTVPFVLAKASTLNYVTPVHSILLVYGVLLLSVWLGMFVMMSSIIRAQSFARTAAAMNPPAAHNRRLFDNLPKGDLAFIAVLGSLPVFAWAMVFVLPSASWAGHVIPLDAIAAIYVMCLGGTVFFMLTLMSSVSTVRAFASRIARKAVALTLLPNAPWELHPHAVQRSGGRPAYAVQPSNTGASNG